MKIALRESGVLTGSARADNRAAVSPIRPMPNGVRVGQTGYPSSLRVSWTTVLAGGVINRFRGGGQAMEGHPIYEDPGAAPIPGRRSHPSDATKKRAFLLLEGKRRSLAAELRPLWRLKGRYEDLSLVMMLARLQRDCLSQPRSRLDGGVHLQGDGDQPAPRLADWAQPWGAAPRMKLETDLGHVDGALRGLGRWLSARTVAKAQDRARERLEAITANLGVRDWARAWAPRPQGEATTARDRAAPTRVAAIAGLSLLAAGAGAFLLLSDTGGGPGDSIGVGAVDGRRSGGAPG